MADYIAYTDGSCNNLSPHGEGGAAYIILKDGVEIKRASKGFMGTTNNRCEMMAIISAVNSVEPGSAITIHTDSQYCIGAFASDNRITHKTKNPDLIAKYRDVAQSKEVRFIWVKGHAGNEYNELVDQLADARTEEMRLSHNIPVYNRFTSPKCNKAGQC